jgi:predicted  nucleic acid-binding Zn-ribbon protein
MSEDDFNFCLRENELLKGELNELRERLEEMEGENLRGSQDSSQGMMALVKEKKELEDGMLELQKDMIDINGERLQVEAKLNEVCQHNE